MTADLLGEHTEDVEEIIIAWLAPLRSTAVARQAGDPLPFTLVTHIAGAEDADLGLAAPVINVATLCDKATGWMAARDEADKTHRRMLLLARHRDPITLTGGRTVSVDYVRVFQAPVWMNFADTEILRKVGRYTVGLSYVPAV